MTPALTAYQKEYYVKNKPVMQKRNSLCYFRRKLKRQGIPYTPLEALGTTNNAKKYSQFLELLKFMRDSFPLILDEALLNPDPTPVSTLSKE